MKTENQNTTTIKKEMIKRYIENCNKEDLTDRLQIIISLWIRGDKNIDSELSFLVAQIVDFDKSFKKGVN